MKAYDLARQVGDCGTATRSARLKMNCDRLGQRTKIRLTRTERKLRSFLMSCYVRSLRVTRLTMCRTVWLHRPTA